jgi:hypothetical protein
MLKKAEKVEKLVQNILNNGEPNYKKHRDELIRLIPKGVLSKKAYKAFEKDNKKLVEKKNKLMDNLKKQLGYALYNKYIDSFLFKGNGLELARKKGVLVEVMRIKFLSSLIYDIQARA